jgi:tripeptidyl-peptidase-1
MSMFTAATTFALLASVAMESDVTFGQAPSWTRRGEWAQHKQQLTISVVLRTDAAAHKKLEEEFWAVSDPGHARYGQHLSQREVTDIVANPRGCDAVASWLTAGGAVAVRRTVHLDAVEADIDVASAAALLNATFYEYVHSTRDLVLPRVGPGGYSVPDSLASLILLVDGVGRLPTLRPRPSPAGVEESEGQQQHEEGDWPKDCGLGHLLCATTPGVLTQAYSLPPPPRSADDVNGSSFGVAEFGKWSGYYDEKDLEHFSKTCHLDPPVAVTHSVGERETSSHCAIPLVAADCGEALLDIEYAGALAGAIPLTSVFATNFSVLRWAQTVAAFNDSAIPLVQSVSYGADEVQPCYSSAYMDAANTAFMQLGVRGVSILVASGDSGPCGNTGCNTYDPDVNFTYSPVFPASSPYVTAVGGTDFVESRKIGPEAAWRNGGGGFSNHFPIPKYQAAAVARYKASSNGTLPNPAWWNNTGRGYPDVSALGGDKNTYCYSGGGLITGTWGTSASCPVVAAIFARLNAVRLGRGGKPLGHLNPWIYRNAAAFNDVTRGVIDGGKKRNGGFAAIKGWDPATGVGTPNWPRMLAAL